MRINLAQIVPVAVVGLFGIVAMTQASDDGRSDASSYGDSSYSDSSPYDSMAGKRTRRADRYLDKVAAELAQPGLYVDPASIGSDLSADEAGDITEAAQAAKGPIRIAVLPATKLLANGADKDAYSADLAYEPEELVGQLYDRVGQDGIYAILVDADSQAAGRSFYAYQWAEEGPTYNVESAVDDALEYAPAYGPMLTRFVESTQHTDPPWGLFILGALGLGGAVIGGGVALRAQSRNRATREADDEVVAELRGPLNEEVVELSAKVAALPPAGEQGGEAAQQIAEATREVLDLVEAARQRLDTMTDPTDAQGVAGRLGDARYQLVVIDALREGREPPKRTAPCFMDPRHGPSVEERPFAPEGGSERQIPVCSACRDALDAGQKPEIRKIVHKGELEFYWRAGPTSRPYVNGYWQRRAYPDAEYERDRNKDAYTPPALPPDREPTFEFVWDDHDDDNPGSGFWSGGGGGRVSSSRSSFGGGSSRRSSSRGGGGRGF